MGPLTESQVEDLVSVLSQGLNLHTGDTVEQTPELPLPPKELIPGDSEPLSAGQTGFQHGIMGQTQEDLQHQAVRQNWDTLHTNILFSMNTHTQSTGTLVCCKVEATSA
uniref:Uncharacterized protein n=1 Tax=Labrus bergylta TaxID=56723 RepID=A0A3Q3FT98_9LABR